MPLSPLTGKEERYLIVNPASSPSLTYRLDFTTGELDGTKIDGSEALRQAISKAIQTARYRYLIYDSQYGCELETLLGQDISQQLLRSEITRVITECLLADDRIMNVERFQIDRSGDRLTITFTVMTKEETWVQEVTW